MVLPSISSALILHRLVNMARNGMQTEDADTGGERLVVSRMCQSSVYNPHLGSREHRRDEINLGSGTSKMCWSSAADANLKASHVIALGDWQLQQRI